MSEAEDYIRDKEKKLMKLKEEKRETNIMELLDFLYRKKSWGKGDASIFHIIYSIYWHYA